MYGLRLSQVSQYVLAYNLGWWYSNAVSETMRNLFNQIYQQWEGMFDDNAARSAAQVAELCEMRDSINRTFLDKPEIMSIIEAIVTD